MLLTDAGHVALVQEEAHISKSRKHTERLNAQLMHKARGSNDVSYLASPVTGGGIVVGRFVQLFLLSMLQGKKKPEEWRSLSGRCSAPKVKSSSRMGK